MNVAQLAEPLLTVVPDFWSHGNRIFVSNPGNIKGEFYLYSIDGRLLERFETAGGNQIIQPAVPTGLYVIRFISQEYNIGRKIFIY